MPNEIPVFDTTGSFYNMEDTDNVPGFYWRYNPPPIPGSPPPPGAVVYTRNNIAIGTQSSGFMTNIDGSTKSTVVIEKSRVVDPSTFAINLSLANYFVVEYSPSIQFTILNIFPSINVNHFVLELRGCKNSNLTWPTGTQWINGLPELTNETDIVSFYSYDNGVTWTASLLGINHFN
jgi:hypothetical protein